MTRTIAILGASSFVGARLFATLGRALPLQGDYQVLGTHFSTPSDTTEYLDITSAPDLRGYLLAKRPDIVILVAGSKDVAACEQDHELAYRLNAVPAEVLCDCIAEHCPDTGVLYLSSDYVFDGCVGGYRSDSPTCPATNYGRSKVRAERRLLRGDVRATVVRTAAVMARQGGFLGWLLGEIQKPGSIALLDNSYFSPTPVELLADCVVAAITGETRGMSKIVHAVGAVRLSRYEFGMLVAEVLRELGVSVRPESLVPDSLAAAKDLSLVPNIFPSAEARGDRILQDYLKRELQNCID